MNRCKCKRFEGNLAIPMTWPVDSSAGRNTFLADDDHVSFLENGEALLGLNHAPESLTNRNRVMSKTKNYGNHFGMKKRWDRGAQQ
ncbi:hypothetical protein CsSME_00015017 [Camellia sinensis var. sinensis]